MYWKVYSCNLECDSSIGHFPNILFTKTDESWKTFPKNHLSKWHFPNQFFTFFSFFHNFFHSLQFFSFFTIFFRFSQFFFSFFHDFFQFFHGLTFSWLFPRFPWFLYAFISFTFQGWIRYRSFCSGRTRGALVKTIKYSKLQIILVIPVCNLTLRLTLSRVSIRTKMRVRQAEAKHA